MSLFHTGDRTLTDLLEERVATAGNRVFLVFEARGGGVSELDYAAFAERVEGCARGLADLGVGPGDRVVVQLRNSPEILVAWFAIVRLGAIFVPANVLSAVPELEHVLQVTNASVAITEPDYRDVIERAIEATGSPATLVIARGDAEDAVAFDDLVAARGEPVPDGARAEDVAELIFTSGTTAKPKAVMLTHANLLRSGLDTVHCLWLDEGERCLTALPLFHVNAQGVSVLSALTVGGTLVVIEEFRASRFWEQVRRHRATQTALVAMQLRTVLAQPPDPTERDHAVRRLFYAINVTDGEKARFEERFAVTLINGYGLSEAMVLVTVAPVVGPRRWPSIGLPTPGRHVLLVDENGNEVPPGVVGEIVVEGVPGRDIMLGYLGDPDATAAAIRDGRLHTGDNAYADEAGYLYFFDRKKDMIKRAGENVSATEVEAALVQHPAVSEVSVFGIPDALRDEAVVAVVVPMTGATPDPDELKAHCAERLARFKVPGTIVFRDELPKTSIGKVRKEELRRELAAATPR
jgi:crotonobetaine/carnitine-CoA ligase